MEKKPMPEGRALSDYIVSNIDRAISEGWIRTYYQPIARTLTGEICGMEALARWIDPEYGLIFPDKFITALEDAGLIYKLDACIIENTCRDYADSMKAGKDPVTVSFNLSRLDFKLCDIYEIIENAIQKNKIPRDAICIEITESMADTEEFHMHEVINKFLSYGYCVWMDDFGSGYSSLNVLKDYSFDTLKIDMVFLRNFNTRSREIIKSVVDMSKRIGIHTLAEGVETKEQFDFLRAIGCEKAQGYFIGRPAPYDECLEHLKKNNFTLERHSKKQYYHDIGCVNVLSAAPMYSSFSDNDDGIYHEEQIPLAIVEYDGENIKYLYSNDKYIEIINSLGVSSTDEIEEEFASGRSSLRVDFTAMMEKAMHTGEVVTSDSIRNGNYCYSQIRKVAEYPNGGAFLCILQNLSLNSKRERKTLLSDYLQSLCQIYELIEVLDINSGTFENLFLSSQPKSDYSGGNWKEKVEQYALEEVYPFDVERLIRFFDAETIESRIEATQTNHLSEPFRIRTTGGSYAWSLFTCLFAGDKKDRRILVCLRRLSKDAVNRLYTEYHTVSKVPDENSNGQEEGVFTSGLLWDCFMNSRELSFFWKDKNRRFVGVNRRFLEYYGFASDKDLIGKTDEEVGWHVDPDPYRFDEERVIENGEQTYLVPGTCIRKGEIRNIIASKMPIFKDGEIVGLMGYFLDVTDFKRKGVSLEQLAINDHMTGMVNVLGLMESMLKYQDSYVFDNMDFVLIVFDIENFDKFRKDFGVQWCIKLLKAVADRLIACVGVQGVAGRFGADRFVMLRQYEDRSDISQYIAQARESVRDIREIDGIMCTVYLKAGYTCYTDSADVMRMLDLADLNLKEG